MIEKEKARRIVDELLKYFFLHEIDKLKIEINFTDSGFASIVSGHCKTLPIDIDTFSEMLNKPRNVSLEDNYDNLLGIHQSNHGMQEYHLLGMMIDEVEISYDNSILKVSIFRRFHD